MELKLENGAYLCRGKTPETVSGAEEIAQRVVLRLTAHRGGFAPLPEYGSRLYLLSRLARPGTYQTTAMQLIAEALEGETAVSVTDVQVTELRENDLRVDITFTVDGQLFQTGITV